MALTNDPVAYASLLSASRWGKSVIMDLLRERMSEFMAPPAYGRASTFSIATDEYGPLNWSAFRTVKKATGPEFSYKTDAFPDATVNIYAGEGAARDPRNPNPSAGPRKFFVIKVGERRVGGEYASLAIAKTFAQRMHKRLIDALVADRQEANPNFGRF